MINHIYQLTAPRAVAIKFEDTFSEGMTIVQPVYMSICQADQRYYQGNRPPSTLAKKLPMALIHECTGQIVSDPTNNFEKGEYVALIPNSPAYEDTEIYENYRKGSIFLSSGADGFMREFVCLPNDRLISVGQADPKIASICEFASVCAHAIERFKAIAHNYRSNIAIWGDGSLAYTLALMIKDTMPNSHITIIGKQESKLNMFSFVDKTYLAAYLPDDFSCDHAFECAGGEGSTYAIDDIIKTINPQGAVMLLGVSENKVPIATRDVLEKGLIIIGCSRSGRKDFETALASMQKPSFQGRIARIIHDAGDVNSIDGIHRVFSFDLDNPFKTVFRWRM